MKFNIGNRQFRVRFAYKSSGQIGGGVLENPVGKPITTEAEIQTFLDNEWQHVSRGSTTCSIKDRFEKSKGRKRALQRALQNTNLIQKSERINVWREYFTAHRDTKPNWYFEELFGNSLPQELAKTPAASWITNVIKGIKNRLTKE